MKKKIVLGFLEGEMEISDDSERFYYPLFTNYDEETKITTYQYILFEKNNDGVFEGKKIIEKGE